MPSNRLVLTAVAGLAACLFLAPGVAAQNQPQVVSEFRPAPLIASPREPDLINIDFPGGTLAEFVQALRQAVVPGQVNVILRSGADAIEVPAVTLRNVTPDSAFAAICPPNLAKVDSVQKSGAPIFVIEKIRSGSIEQIQSPEATRALGQAIYRDRAQPDPFALRIYSVRNIVSGSIPLEAVMDAVKTALSVQRDQPQPELLYHEGSGVLIVRGSDSQHVVVSELLKTLERDSERLRGLAEREANMARVMQERILGMQAEIEQTQLEVDLKRAQVAELQQAVQQGLLSEEDFRHANIDLRQTELRVRHMQAELQAAQDQSEAMRSSGLPSQPPAAAEGSSKIAAKHPKQVQALVEALVTITSVNPRSRVLGFEVQNDRIVVRYAGSKEGVEHLAHVCKLIELLDQGD